MIYDEITELKTKLKNLQSKEKLESLPVHKEISKINK
jgi:hypothetical protein